MPVLFRKAFSIVQDSADAFKEIKIELPRQTDEVVWLYGIEIDPDPVLLFVGIVQDDDFQIQLCKEPQTAILTIDNHNVLFKKSYTCLVQGTAAEGKIMETPIKLPCDPPVPIDQTDVYLGIDSTGNGTALTIKGNLLFTVNVPKKSTVEKIRKRY